MKHIALSFFLILGLTSFVNMPAMSSNMKKDVLKQGASMDNKTIVVGKNSKEFEVRLKSNPSTGFSWYLQKYDDSLMEVLSHQYISNEKHIMPGAPGYTLWKFQVKEKAHTVPQASDIEFVYMRPWDKSQVKTEKITIVFGEVELKKKSKD